MKRKINHKRQYQASYTIEAAVVIPITIFIIIDIIYICFYMHDTLSINTEMYSYALTHYRGEEETDNVNKSLATHLDNKLLVAKSTYVNYEQEDNKIDITAYYHFDIPFKGLKALLGNEYGQKEIHSKISNLKKSDYLRKYKAISELQKE